MRAGAVRNTSGDRGRGRLVGWVSLLVLLLFGCVHPPDPLGSDRLTAVLKQDIMAMQAQDLVLVRELNRQVRDGKITKQERELLWEAYLARLRAIDRVRSHESWATKYLRNFAAPGF